MNRGAGGAGGNSEHLLGDPVQLAEGVESKHGHGYLLQALIGPPTTLVGGSVRCQFWHSTPPSAKP